jgi:hypothetical protein
LVTKVLPSALLCSLSVCLDSRLPGTQQSPCSPAAFAQTYVIRPRASNLFLQLPDISPLPTLSRRECVSLHSLCLPTPTLASIENRTVSTSSKYYTISVRVLYRKRRRKSLVFLFPVWYGRVYQQTTLDRKLLYSSVPDLFISSFLLLCTHPKRWQMGDNDVGGRVKCVYYQLWFFYGSKMNKLPRSIDKLY